MNTLKVFISLVLVSCFFSLNQSVYALSDCEKFVESRRNSYSDHIYTNPKWIKVLEERLSNAKQICRHPESTYPLMIKLAKERLRFALNLEQVENDLMQMERYYGEQLEYDYWNYAEVTLLTAELYSLLGKNLLSSYYARKAMPLLKDEKLKYHSAISLLLQSSISSDIGLTDLEINGYDAFDDREKILFWVKQTTLTPTVLIAVREAHLRYNRYLRYHIFKGDINKAIALIDATELSSLDVEQYQYVDQLFVDTMLLSDILKPTRYRNSYSFVLRSKMTDSAFYISNINQVKVHLLCALFNKRPSIIFSEAELAIDKLREIRALEGGYVARDSAVEVEFLIEKLLKHISEQKINAKAAQLMFSLAQMTGVDNPLLSYAIKKNKNPIFRKKLIELEKKEERNRQLVYEIGIALHEEKNVEGLHKELDRNRDESYALKQLLLKDEVLVKGRDVLLDQVQNKLGYKEQLIFTTDIGGSCFFFKVSSDGFQVIAFDKPHIHNILKEHRANVQENKFAEKSGSALYHLLGFDIDKETITTSFVVADGVFSQLPFSTLYNEHDKKWLIQEQFVSRYLNLGFFVNHVSKKAVYSNRLAIAYSKYDTNVSTGKAVSLNFGKLVSQGNRGSLADDKSLKRVYQSFPFLDGVEQEALAITGALSSKRRILKGKDARKDSFLKLVDNGHWDLLSFSTHTFYPTYSCPLKYPSLLFARDEQDNIFEGFLSAEEISSLSFDNAFVILAACETAVAADAGGSMNSLLSSFKFAGAQRILATHWKVSNELAGKFVKHFAKCIEISGEGSDASKKLWRAQLMALKQTGILSTPAVWGAWDVYQ